MTQAEVDSHVEKQSDKLLSAVQEAEKLKSEKVFCPQLPSIHLRFGLFAL